MNIARISLIILQIAILFLTISCSNSEDSNEKGVVQEKQDEIAQEAIDYIKNPIDQAKAVSKIADDRARQLEETKKQE